MVEVKRGALWEMTKWWISDKLLLKLLTDNNAGYFDITHHRTDYYGVVCLLNN